MYMTMRFMTVAINLQYSAAFVLFAFGLRHVACVWLSTGRLPASSSWLYKQFSGFYRMLSVFAFVFVSDNNSALFPAKLSTVINRQLRGSAIYSTE